jgi:AbrB family looped-hinge helix DNA binding protein
MAEATLSSKYQLVIPKEVRKETGLKSGEKIIILVKDGIINLIPSHLLSKMRGFLKGMDTKNIREEEER